MDGVIQLTNEQARRFLLCKQGLLGAHRYLGKQGALDYIRSVGSVQFDPVDVCGKNAELVLHSRVAGFTKAMLFDLLYKDRTLIDYFDKNMCILPVENWPHFERIRNLYREHERARNDIAAVREEIKDAIRARGALSSADLDYQEKVSWFWSDTRLSRAALELLYFCGELAVHHKKGSIKYYDLVENCIPEGILHAPDPCPDEEDHLKWLVERRVSAVGLLWNRHSHAFLGIDALKTAERNQAFSALLSEGHLAAIAVEGIREPFYCCARDAELIDFVKTDHSLHARCEFIAPLDCLLWDRKLISALFGFDYKWEIYTPEAQCKFGHYVLPILWGYRFVGRIELSRNKDTGIEIKNIWYEDGVRQTKTLVKQIEARVVRFACYDRSASSESSR